MKGVLSDSWSICGARAWKMINTRTKAGIAKAIADGVKFSRRVESQNKSTADKIENIKIFLQAKKTYNWIAKELSVSKETIERVKTQISLF